MALSISAFAKLAGVSRQAIYDALKRGTVVRDENGKIDPDNPVNRSYLAGTMGGTSRHGPKKGRGGTRKRKASGGGGSGGEAARAAERVETKPPEPQPQKPQRPPQADDTTDEEKRRLLVGAGISNPDALIAESDTKTYWDVLKVKEQALTARINREEKLGRLVEVSIVTSQIGAFQQSIVANFVDSPQRQAIQICQMLGADGKEREVTEYLEKDNARRLAEVDRAVGAMRDRLRRGVKGGK